MRVSMRKLVNGGRLPQQKKYLQENILQVLLFYKDIIAGHIGTYSLKADKNFHGVYWDGMSHYFIDGSVNISGVIPLLMYDLESNKYIY